MSLVSDLRILYQLIRSPSSGATHAERLESFYAGQASSYDDFRSRLLQGRREMFQAIPINTDSVWVDMGGGTGGNLAFIADKLHQIRHFYVVDLARSLLAIAGQRALDNGWQQVTTAEADVTTFMPPETQVDIITFSYSLTMIPAWYSAIDHAWKLLKPGGYLGVVDFFVSRKFPPPGCAAQSAFTRGFWPAWFARDNVFLSPDHIPYLQSKFEQVTLVERRARLPYLPGSRVPYYRYIGRKPLV